MNLTLLIPGWKLQKRLALGKKRHTNTYINAKYKLNVTMSTHLPEVELKFYIHSLL